MVRDANANDAGERRRNYIKRLAIGALRSRDVFKMKRV